jgi:hypothetical protein
LLDEDASSPRRSFNSGPESGPRLT